jgi:hypothetical protein
MTAGEDDQTTSHTQKQRRPRIDHGYRETNYKIGQTAIGWNLAGDSWHSTALVTRGTRIQIVGHVTLTKHGTSTDGIPGRRSWGIIYRRIGGKGTRTGGNPRTRLSPLGLSQH